MFIRNFVGYSTRSVLRLVLELWESRGCVTCQRSDIRFHREWDGSEPPSWSLLRFNQERVFEFLSSVYDFPSLISRPLDWSCLSLEVHSASKPPSWSLPRFRHKRDFEFSSLVYDFPYSDFLSSGLIVSALEVLSGSKPPSWSLLSFRLRFRIARDC